MELIENNAIQFTSITKKREGLFANFKIHFIRNGVVCASRVAVDFAAAEVDAADPMEKIIEECARLAVREVQRAELQFSGLMAV